VFVCAFLLISAPSLGVIIVNIINSVCLSVCHTPSSCFFFFCFSMESSHFLAASSPCGTLQNVVIRFLISPQRTKFTPQNLHKIAYQSACMADRPEMFEPTRGFSGMADSWNHVKCCGADTCCHGNEIWARRGVQSPTGFFLFLTSARRYCDRSCLFVC